MKNKIVSVRIEKRVDVDPDISYLGEYVASPQSAYTITRAHVDRNEYAFFEPNWKNYEGETEEDIRKHCQEDYKRAEALQRGDWVYIGIVAKAVVQSRQFGTLQTFRSGGLWGIESDSEESYLESVANEQLAELRAELESFGFKKRAIDYAFKNELNIISL